MANERVKIFSFRVSNAAVTYAGQQFSSDAMKRARGHLHTPDKMMQAMNDFFETNECGVITKIDTSLAVLATDQDRRTSVIDMFVTVNYIPAEYCDEITVPHVTFLRYSTNSRSASFISEKDYSNMAHKKRVQDDLQNPDIIEDSINEYLAQLNGEIITTKMTLLPIITESDRRGSVVDIIYMIVYEPN